MDHGTLKNYKSVSERVESSLRNDDLSFNHHVEVAKLTPEGQQRGEIASQNKGGANIPNGVPDSNTVKTLTDIGWLPWSQFCFQ